MTRELVAFIKRLWFCILLGQHRASAKRLWTAGHEKNGDTFHHHRLVLQVCWRCGSVML